MVGTLPSVDLSVQTLNIVSQSIVEVIPLMGGVKLYDYQLDAVKRMKIGCILCGGVGSGDRKSVGRERV